MLNRVLTILAVDDDALILMNTAVLLEDLGHNVVEANSGLEALDLIKARSDIDLMITDQVMPGMSGTDLILAVRAFRTDLPIVLASGYGESVGEAEPGLYRLAKPFGQADLEKAILTAIGQP